MRPEPVEGHIPRGFDKLSPHDQPMCPEPAGCALSLSKGTFRGASTSSAHMINQCALSPSKGKFRGARATAQRTIADA
jgi:hypothetical protein